MGFSVCLQVDCCKKLEMLVLDNTQPTNHSLNSDFSCVLVLVSSLNTDMSIVHNTGNKPIHNSLNPWIVIYIWKKNNNTLLVFKLNNMYYGFLITVSKTWSQRFSWRRERMEADWRLLQEDAHAWCATLARDWITRMIYNLSSLNLKVHVSVS